MAFQVEARPSGGEAISRRVQELGTHDRHLHTAGGFDTRSSITVGTSEPTGRSGGVTAVPVWSAQRVEMQEKLDAGSQSSERMKGMWPSCAVVK